MLSARDGMRPVQNKSLYRSELLFRLLVSFGEATRRTGRVEGICRVKKDIDKTIRWTL